MQHLKAGTTVLILNHRWYDGRRGQILSSTATGYMVKIDEPFSLEKTIELTAEDLIALDQIKPVTEGPFHTGDTVFVHKAAYEMPQDQGQTGTVISAFLTWQKCLVHLDEEDQDDTLYSFHALSLIAPERRTPDEDYLRAIAHAVPGRGYWRRYNEWWQQQADRKLWPIAELPDLYRAGQEIETQINTEIAIEIEKQGQLLNQAFSNLTSAQKVEKWQAEWYSWTEYRSYNNELTAEDKLLKAIFGEDTQEEETKEPENSTQTAEEQGQDYGYRNSGPELLERCEKYMQRLAQTEKGYAYDRIPFRQFVSPPATSISTTTASQQETQRTEPFIPLERELALLYLKNEGEHFTAALASLASQADDPATDALLEKYTGLQAREGFDEQRYHSINRLALALFATRRKDAIETVLQHEISLKSWGDTSLYSIQGVMLKGETQALFWDEKNPWQIKSDQGLQNAIAQIWSPVMPYAPRFVTLLMEYTVGLALFKHKETGSYALGYLHLVPLESYQYHKYNVKPNVPTDISIYHLVEWLDQGQLCLLLGHLPRNPDHDSLEHLQHFRLPLAMHELYAIHSGLDSAGGYTLVGPAQLHHLLNWIDETSAYLLNRFHARNLALSPDQFVAFAPDGFGNTYVFDLDCLDERHDPQIADWDHETWEISGRQPFWQWFVDFAPRSLLGLSEENEHLLKGKHNEPAHRNDVS